MKIHYQISFLDEVYQGKNIFTTGKFSEQWLMESHGKHIIMKVFKNKDKDLWTREKDIRNIKAFNWWTITTFMGSKTCNGSLQDYVKRKRFDNAELVALIASAADGLGYLHTRCPMDQSWRPAVVHRNITSKSILVTGYRRCVISDFEFALRDDVKFNSKMDLRHCTPRYAAPEMLNKTITSFQGFRKADVYSLGIVFWEISRRSLDFEHEYSLPFENVFKKDPTVSEMKKLFANKREIYEILGPVTSEKDDNLGAFIQKCIHRNPKLRTHTNRLMGSFHESIKELSLAMAKGGKEIIYQGC